MLSNSVEMKLRTMKKKAIHASVALATGICLLLVGYTMKTMRDAALWSEASGRAKDIFVALTPGMSCDGLGLGSVWPRAGEGKAEGAEKDPIMQYFENSSDYFWVLLDGETEHTEEWAPYVSRLDWRHFAGGGVPPKQRAGRLTAENNIWTIAANVTEDMPDHIPFIVSRNVDPASLIPHDGDLKAQRIRPSPDFKTPFGDKHFVVVLKGGAIRHLSGKNANLHTLYKGRWEEGEDGRKQEWNADADPAPQLIQALQSAFQKIRYLAP